MLSFLNILILFPIPEKGNQQRKVLKGLRLWVTRIRYLTAHLLFLIIYFLISIFFLSKLIFLSLKIKINKQTTNMLFNIAYTFNFIYIPHFPLAKENTKLPPNPCKFWIRNKGIITWYRKTLTNIEKIILKVSFYVWKKFIFWFYLYGWDIS